jgi:hypothetical protein
MADHEFTKKEEKTSSLIALDMLPRSGGSSAHSFKTLADNQYVREHGGAPTDTLDWGYCALSIPPKHMAVLCTRFPDLASPSQDVQWVAWQKFLRSPESEPYKVRRNDGKVLRHL